MTVSEIVNNSFPFEVPYNVVRWDWETVEKNVLFSNFLTDEIPSEIGEMKITHVIMQDGYIEIEV